MGLPAKRPTKPTLSELFHRSCRQERNDTIGPSGRPALRGRRALPIGTNTPPQNMVVPMVQQAPEIGSTFKIEPI